jgi:hypothetical protein
MGIRQLSLLIIASSSLLFFVNSIFPEKIQAQPKLCSDDGNYEPASSTYKTVELPEFGIQVNIPDNYRTMKRNDGSVAIVHPDDFEHLQCMANGGLGGRGYYSEVIQLVDRDDSISLREQAMRTRGYDHDAQGNQILSSDNVLDYKQGDLSGYIAFTKNSPTFNGAVFLGEVPGTEKVLEIYPSCDCDTTVDDLKDLLSRVKWIEKTSASTAGSRISVEENTSALVGRQIKYSGSFTNTTKNLSGDVFIHLIFEPSDRVSGYINFTNYPNVRTLCGAGNFTGVKQGRTIVFTFISNDPESDCGVDRGWVFTVRATLSPDNMVLEDGTYQVDTGGYNDARGVFRVVANDQR